jgi:DNA polymerase I
MRWLIMPGPGRGIGYVDLKSAEFGIAAALSHDEVMKADYLSMVAGNIECVYFELAKRANQVPADACIRDYKAVRNIWKTACLALMYGQWPEGLAYATGISFSEARVIHSAFRQRYSAYWAWTACEVVHAHVGGVIETVCGWKMTVNDRTEDRTLLNFHCQGTCGDVMRRAIALMADRGIAICEIVHDAVVVEDNVEALQDTVEITQACWREASREVLGFELEADAKLCKYPDGYEDDDGEPMWRLLKELLDQAEERAEGELAHRDVAG